jgi:hypothetical protein
MANEIIRKGYAQVEPNHLSAQYTGQIYAQLPAKTDATHPIAQLENGQFLKYNYKDGFANTTGDAEWMLVYNEEKLYDERRQMHKDFVMKASEQSDGVIYPRLLKINIGDIFTTNAFRSSTPATVTGPDDTITTLNYAVGEYVVVGSAGWLEKSSGTTPGASKPDSGICFLVVSRTTLPDTQEAVKLQRIQ